jgi:serine protease Do
MIRLARLAATTALSATLALPLMLAHAPVAQSASATAAPVTGRGEQVPESFADLSQNLLPAVVNIATTQEIKQGPVEQELPQLPPGSPLEDLFREFFERNMTPPGQAMPRKATSLGSGFIIDPAGFIVTNNHVISDADEIKVILNDKTELSATVVGRDTKMDLALLKVDAKKTLPYVKWGNSDAARVGDWVIAIGNPFGLGGTVTQGIVSARARNINAGPYDDFIQTDAAINRGNSGGPMFDMAGHVIGVNTAIFSPSGGSIGIGFAIPSNLVRPLIEQIKTYGKPRRGWLGVQIQTVTPEIADSIGLDSPRGALVAGADPQAPAAKAGIRNGDVILKFGNTAIGEMRELPRVVAETPIGTTVPVEVWREGRAQTVQVNVAEMSTDDGTADKTHSASEMPKGTVVLGLKVADLSAVTRQRLGIPAEVTGVLITAVETSSDAAEKGIRPGDVITEANQQAVATVKGLQTQVAAARKQGKRSLLLLLQNREAERTYRAITLTETKKP